MYKLFLIGMGGFIGALLRYGVSGLVQTWSKSISFPYGTLAVNLLGCFVIGFLSQLVETRSVFSPEARSFALVGLVGAFTTYSTFGNETVNLVMDGENLLAVANVGLHLLLGLVAVWVGRVLVPFLWR